MFLFDCVLLGETFGKQGVWKVRPLENAKDNNKGEREHIFMHMYDPNSKCTLYLPSSFIDWAWWFILICIGFFLF